MWIADLSIRKPVMTVMVIGGLMLMGYVSIDRLGVDLFPKVEFPYIAVQTILEGAAPGVMETEVTDPIEEEVNSIAGIQSLNSLSTDSLSMVMVEFELDEDPDIKAQEVRNKVDLAVSKLPLDTETPIVQKMDPNADPIVTIMISGDMTIKELTEYADKVVKERLQRVTGVGGIQILGGREKEIRFWLDAFSLRSYGITVQDIVNAVRMEHAEIPGGRLEARGRHSEFLIKTKGELLDVKDFENIVISRRNGGNIRVGDVARVIDGMEDERTYAELDGIPGVALDIRRQSGKNTVEVVHGIRKALQEIRREAPPGVSLVEAKDISRFIESSVRDVKVDLTIGIMLVVMVTLVFLLNVRATLIVATAIPTALISTFFAFYVLDFSINMLTMMALSVAIGLLVDDAIVVLESIYSHLEQGFTPAEAASKGTEKVGGAVIAGTLSVMGVFVPIAFMEGIVGRFFFQYGLTIVFSVGISLLVSLTLTPMLCSRLLKTGPDPRGMFLVFENVYQFVERIYQKLLKASLRQRWLIILAAVLATYGGANLASKIPLAFSAKTDRSEFTAHIQLPLGTGIEASKIVGQRVAKAISQVPHVNLVFMSIGSGSVSKVNEIDFYIGITPKADRDINFQYIMDEVRNLLPDTAPEAKSTNMAEVPWISGGGSSQFLNDVYLVFQGPDLVVLEDISGRVLNRMKESGNFKDIATSYELGNPEVHIDIDRERAADLGITVRNLATTIRAAVGGADITTFQKDASRYDVRIRLEESNRDQISKLNLIQVRSNTGSLVDLSNIADFTISSGPVQIERRNRARQIGVFANAPPGVAVGVVMEDADQIVAEAELPPGYSAEYEGQSEQTKESFEAITFAFGMALIILYMILASQFNSFGQPVVIMFTAPLSFIGAFAALYVFSGELSLFAQIGLIALMGLVMKNGILLVDYANQRRNEGSDSREAMLLAGQMRLRPVLMTAFSTIFGLIPVAFSTSDGAEFRNALGIIIIGGMFSSTMLTLLVVPVVYTLYDDVISILLRGLDSAKSYAIQLISREE
jgi:HAE1 family hydrophobic/amphiphilic exporter-1